MGEVNKIHSRTKLTKPVKADQGDISFKLLFAQALDILLRVVPPLKMQPSLRMTSKSGLAASCAVLIIVNAVFTVVKYSR